MGESAALCTSSLSMGEFTPESVNFQLQAWGLQFGFLFVSLSWVSIYETPLWTGFSDSLEQQAVFESQFSVFFNIFFVILSLPLPLRPLTSSFHTSPLLSLCTYISVDLLPHNSGSFSLRLGARAPTLCHWLPMRLAACVLSNGLCCQPAALCSHRQIELSNGSNWWSDRQEQTCNCHVSPCADHRRDIQSQLVVGTSSWIHKWFKCEPEKLLLHHLHHFPFFVVKLNKIVFVAEMLLSQTQGENF